MSGTIVFYLLSYGPATALAIATIWLTLRDAPSRKRGPMQLRPIRLRSEARDARFGRRR